MSHLTPQTYQHVGTTEPNLLYVRENDLEALKAQRDRLRATLQQLKTQRDALVMLRVLLDDERMIDWSIRVVQRMDAAFGVLEDGDLEEVGGTIYG